MYMLDENGNAKSLGGDGILTVNANALRITYENGDTCGSGHYNSILNLHCRKGMFQSLPYSNYLCSLS